MAFTHIPSRTGSVALAVLLCLPVLPMLLPVALGVLPIRHAIALSGTFAAQLLVFVLALGPVSALMPQVRPVRWLLARRRLFGLACFGYAVLHMVVFAIGIGRLDHIVQGMAFTSMWTGWLALLLLLPLGLTSNAAAMRRLGANWKRLHRLAYPAAALVLAHWILLTPTPAEAVILFGALVALQGARLYASRRNAIRRTQR